MKKLTVLFFLCIIPFIANATISEMSFGKWNIKFDDETKRAEFVKEGVTVLKDVKIKFKNGDVLLDASSYNSVKIKQEDIVDEVGKARKFTIEYTGSENSDNPTVYQQRPQYCIRPTIRLYQAIILRLSVPKPIICFYLPTLIIDL